MKISIVVPVYKVEDCLERCVDSLIAQTYGNIEIILVDDGSPDGCPALCDKYAESDSRVTVIHKPNGGLSDARNAGLEMASGDYVLFVDSDDYIELDTCERFLPYLESGADIAMGGCIEVTQSGYACKHCDSISAGDELDGGTYIKKALTGKKLPFMVWLNFYRRDFLRDNALVFKKGFIHEDVDFTFRANLVAGRVVYTGVMFYHYIIKEESITTTKDKRRNCRDIYKIALDIISDIKNLPDKKLRRLIESSLASNYMSIYRAGKLYRYGKEFTHKGFAFKHSRTFKSKLKAIIFAISPRLFCNL